MKFNKDILLKTQNKVEFEKTSSTAISVLNKSVGSKIEHNLYTQSVYYEPNRLSAYFDFEGIGCILGDTRLQRPMVLLPLKN